MKICPVEDELFHEDGQTDGQTDMMNVIVALRNFANALKTFCIMLTECIYVFRVILIIKNQYDHNPIYPVIGSQCVQCKALNI